MSTNIPQTYKEHERQYKLLKKFGKQKLLAILESENKQQGLTAKIDKSVVNDMSLSLLSGLDPNLASNLLKVETRMKAEHTPQAIQDPKLVNKNQGATITDPGLNKGFEEASWMAKIDKSTNPDLINAVDAFRNQPNDQTRQALTTQLDMAMDKLKNELQNEYKMRNAPRFAPRPSAPRPKKPGE